MDCEYQKGYTNVFVNKTWEIIKLVIKNTADNVFTKMKRKNQEKHGLTR